ncbi:hypothetical protein [Sediminibacterium sp.]|uniref:hypothetical protein n=1 Tax=Sediminibacterium sp. TaxID=1917865 RepID=UPI002732EDC6|nr:hypothetical protein [Sediminibacterium sp.]
MSVLFYSDILHINADSFAGMMLFFLAPFIILIHLIISCVLEKRKNHYNETFYFWGGIFLVVPLFFMATGLKFY